MTKTTTDMLREIRDEGGLKQTEISARTGIPQPRISRWLSGGAPDTADSALRVQALHQALKLGRKVRA